MLVERLYQVWYVYTDGREGCLSRPDEPMTHEHALRFRKGCMQGVKGRRLELREVVGFAKANRWVGWGDGYEGDLNRPDNILTHQQESREFDGLVAERRFGIWVGYEDGREGYLNRPDKPLTYEGAARFTQGMPGVVEGRRVEIREIGSTP
jgi:hypothetical protein